jgi:Core-2/I-Branching enzyme
MAKFLYLIASHTNPAQVVRLLKKIKSESPDAEILLHHDASKVDFPRSQVASLTGMHFAEKPIAAKWGTFAQVRMVLNCFKHLRDRSIHYDWIVFISGQDYPIRPLPEFERYVMGLNVDGLIEHDWILRTDWLASLREENTTRYCYRYVRLPGVMRYVLRPRSLIGKFNRSQTAIYVRNGQVGCWLGFRRRTILFDESFRCYRGSQWFTLARNCVEYVSEFVDANPGVVKYYKRTVIPDASFFQTILLNKKTFKFVNDNGVYRRFLGDAASPEILRAQDYSTLMTSGKYFARKFDSKVDPKILDLLDLRSKPV